MAKHVIPSTANNVVVLSDEAAHYFFACERADNPLLNEGERAEYEAVRKRAYQLWKGVTTEAL